MADFFYKNCDRCTESIRMAQMNNGQWLAFEAHRDGKHICGSNAAEPVASTLSATPQAKQRPPLPPGLQPRANDDSNGIFGWPALLLVFAFWAIANQIFRAWQ